MSFSRSNKGSKLGQSPLAQRFLRHAVERVVGEHAYDILMGDPSTSARSHKERLMRVACNSCQFEFHVRPDSVDRITMCPSCGANGNSGVET